MKPFETLAEAEEWMDSNAGGEISVYIEALNILEASRPRKRLYSIPANGPARVTLTWNCGVTLDPTPFR